jgi:uncharacterized membrane protein
MGIFAVVLLVATLLCSLVAGLLFAFAVIVMPGIGRLDARGFIRAFRAIDGVIQDNQPLFIVIWLGSVVALVVAAILGIGSFAGAATTELDRWLLFVATLVYLLGVQAPTILVNVPLNNGLQSLMVDSMDDVATVEARGAFEARWNRWNVIRTVAASTTTALLLITLLGLEGP